MKLEQVIEFMPESIRAKISHRTFRPGEFVVRKGERADHVYILTKGNNGTGSVSILGYNNLFKAFNLGIGSAISVLIFLCVAVIAFIFVKGLGASTPGNGKE